MTGLLARVTALPQMGLLARVTALPQMGLLARITALPHYGVSLTTYIILFTRRGRAYGYSSMGRSYGGVVVRRALLCFRRATDPSY